LSLTPPSATLFPYTTLFRSLSLGYDVNRYKLLAYVLSATLAGLAGATKVLVFELASLTDVHWTMSGEVVLMVLLGGLGTVFGPRSEEHTSELQSRVDLVCRL